MRGWHSPTQPAIEAFIEISENAAVSFVFVEAVLTSDSDR